MSMPRAVRHINETRALEALFRSGPMSRADLARQLHVTRSTASSIVAALVKAGYAEVDGAEPADRGARTGRPGTNVRLRPQRAIFVGADVGVKRGTVAAIDLAAETVALETCTFDPDRPSPEAVADQLAALIRSVVAGVQVPSAISGLNITVPGLVDHDGNVLRAPIRDWANVPILALMRERLPEIDVVGVENDANAFALADLYRAGEKAVQEAAYVFLDSGVGGALVSKGQLLRGTDGYAGEVGHMIIGEAGYVEVTSLRGSFEGYVGRQAVLARHRHHGGDTGSVREFLDILAAGDAAARATLADWAHHLGRGLASLASILNPERIVLGGAVAALFAQAEQAVAASLRRHMPPGSRVPRVVLSALGSEAPAIGAALMLHRDAFALDERLVFQGSAPPDLDEAV